LCPVPETGPARALFDAITAIAILMGMPQRQRRAL
jgi:hypothetical protein